MKRASSTKKELAAAKAALSAAEDLLATALQQTRRAPRAQKVKVTEAVDHALANVRLARAHLDRVAGVDDAQ